MKGLQISFQYLVQKTIKIISKFHKKEIYFGVSASR